LRPAQANSLQDPISKITKAKWTGGVAQAVESLIYKCQALTSIPSPTKNKHKKPQLFKCAQQNTLSPHKKKIPCIFLFGIKGQVSLTFLVGLTHLKDQFYFSNWLCIRFAFLFER
jgi:hypothetical protein